MLKILIASLIVALVLNASVTETATDVPTTESTAETVEVVETTTVAETTEVTEVTEVTEPIVETEPVVEVEEVTEPMETIEATGATEATGVHDEYLGRFKLTAYCACPICCGEWADGITATGTVATQGRTIAVDPSVIPYGSKVRIKDNIYIAEDCGGAIKENRIDVFFDDHNEALNYGVQYEDVYLVGVD